MKYNEQLLEAIYLEFKETYKTSLNSENMSMETKKGINDNLWVLRAEFYKCKCHILGKKIKQKECTQ